MEKIPFSELVIRPQNRKKVIRRFSRLNFGIDTETYQGKVKLICDSFGRKFYPQSYGELLEFLCYFQYRNKFGFFWNIKYDFESVVKWFPLDNVRELLEYRKTRIDGYHIQYLDGKTGE